MELVFGLIVMFITWLVFRVVTAGIYWLYDNSNVARSVIEVIGMLCMISIAKNIIDRKDRP